VLKVKPVIVYVLLDLFLMASFLVRWRLIEKVVAFLQEDYLACIPLPGISSMTQLCQGFHFMRRVLYHSATPHLELGRLEILFSPCTR
jgi:hypothetical protein